MAVRREPETGWPKEVGVEQRLHRIKTVTHGRSLIAVADQVCGWIGQQGIVTGLLTIWYRHTAASLLVQENASLDVRADLEAFRARLVLDGGAGRYRLRKRGQMTCPPLSALR
jgi:thiamine phosphate synthase YjbQ (UPF0047 family)